jgi:hypothetical protein
LNATPNAPEKVARLCHFHFATKPIDPLAMSNLPCQIVT